MSPKVQKFSPELLSHTATRLRALADEVRLRILLRLRAGECNVTSLVIDLGVAQASVSKHLALLRQSGFVKVRRDGANSFYSIRDESLFEVLRITFEGVRRLHSETTSAIGIRGSNFEI